MSYDPSSVLWRIGGLERRRVIDSIHAMLAQNGAQFVDELQTVWAYDPDEAAQVARDMAGAFWHQLIDDAIAEGATPRYGCEATP